MDSKQKKICLWVAIYWLLFTLGLAFWGLWYSHKGAHAPHYYYTNVLLDQRGEQLACFRSDANHPDQGPELVVVDLGSNRVTTQQSYLTTEQPELVDWTPDGSGLIQRHPDGDWSILWLEQHQQQKIQLPSNDFHVLSHAQGSLFFSKEPTNEEPQKLFLWSPNNPQTIPFNIDSYLTPSANIKNLVPSPDRKTLAVIVHYPYLESPYQLGFYHIAEQSWHPTPIHSDIPIGFCWSSEHGSIVTYTHGEKSFLSLLQTPHEANYTTYQTGFTQKPIDPYFLDDNTIYLAQEQRILTFDQEEKTAKGIELNEEFTERPLLTLFPPSSIALIDNEYGEFEQVQLYDLTSHEITKPFPPSPQRKILSNRWFKVANMIRYALTGENIHLSSTPKELQAHKNHPPQVVSLAK